MRDLTRAVLAAVLATATVLPLIGCAQTRGGPGIIAREREELRAQCAARGGILVPSGAATGRPPLDEFCEIHGPSAPPR